MIKVEDVSEPLTETPARVAEAVLLFCQVSTVSTKVGYFISSCREWVSFPLLQGDLPDKTVLSVMVALVITGWSLHVNVEIIYTYHNDSKFTERPPHHQKCLKS